MVEILAIVRRNRATATKAELARIGCGGYSVWPVLGRGRQRGLQGQGGKGAFSFLPKVCVDLVVEDELAQEAIEAVIRANQTSDFGDGRIFVLEISGAYRISTGERTPSEVTA